MEREPRFSPRPDDFEPLGSSDHEEEKSGLEFLDPETGEVVDPPDMRDKSALKYFKMDTVHERRTEWEQESGRITEELNWEDDDDVLEIYARINERIKGLEEDQYSETLHVQFEREETDQFVVDCPEKAAEYAELWEQWAHTAGVDSRIDDKEWTILLRAYPSAAYMGQYRLIAQAVRRTTYR